MFELICRDTDYVRSLLEYTRHCFLFWTPLNNNSLMTTMLVLHINCYCTVTTDDGYWIWCSTRVWGLWEMMLYCLVECSCCFKGSCLHLHGLQVQGDCFDCLIMKTEALQSTKTAWTTLPMPQHHIPEASDPQQPHHMILQFCTVWNMFNTANKNKRRKRLCQTLQPCSYPISETAF